MLTDNEEAVLLNLQACMMANTAASSATTLSAPVGSQSHPVQPDVALEVKLADAQPQQHLKRWSQVTILVVSVAASIML